MGLQDMPVPALYTWVGERQGLSVKWVHLWETGSMEKDARSQVHVSGEGWCPLCCPGSRGPAWAFEDILKSQ